MRLFKIVIFHRTLGFLNTYPPIFFKYYPKFERNIRSKALYPNFLRYFRSLFLFTEEEEAEVRKQVLAFVPAAISELLKRFPSTEGFLWVNLFCEFFIKKRHEHILKMLHFLSLRYSADFHQITSLFCLSWFTTLIWRSNIWNVVSNEIVANDSLKQYFSWKLCGLHGLISSKLVLLSSHHVD